MRADGIINIVFKVIVSIAFEGMRRLTLVLQELKSLSARGVRGPAPSFDEVHIARALCLLYDNPPLGRITLSKSLGIGEGAARTLIRKLSSLGLLKVDAVGGCLLTEKGEELAQRLRKLFPKSLQLNLPSLKIGRHGYAVLIRRSISDQKVILIRDVAVRYGATGALVVKYCEGRLEVPLVYDDLKSEYPSEAQAILSKLEPKDGDTIIIAFSDTTLKAEHAAWAASLHAVEGGAT